MNTFLPLIFLTAVLLSGCAASPPLMPISHPDERIQFNGFSILPPKAAGWNWVGREGQDKSMFFNTSFVKKDGDRTYVAMAVLADTQGEKYTPDELLSKVSTYEILQEGPRQSNLESTVKIDHSLGIPCVRFDLTAEDHNVPNKPNTVYKLDAHGYFCSHPTADGVLMNIAYTRRAPEQKPYVGGTEEGERFLGSVQFSPVRR